MIVRRFLKKDVRKLVISFVQLDSVSHQYGADSPAVDDVSFSIAKGEVVGLVGPNGAGKSTLAKLIAGFLAPSAGKIQVGGLAPEEFRQRSGVGYVGETSFDFPQCTGYDLLAMRTSASGADSPADVKRVLQLDDLLPRMLITLSKGQRRLVDVAYATMTAPALIILDEPDSGLDVLGLDRLREVVRLMSASGATSVVLSHRLRELVPMCDRLLVIKAGRLVGDLDPHTTDVSAIEDYYREQFR